MYSPCQKDEYYSKQFFRTSKMKKKFDENKKTFDYLHQHTGITFFRNELLYASYSLYNIFDTLKIEVCIVFTNTRIILGTYM